MKSEREKILIYSIAYDPFWGGAEVSWKEITDRLIDFEFHMITPKYDKNLPDIEQIGNIKVFRLGFGNRLDKFILPVFGPLKGLSLNRKYSYSWVIGIIYNHASLAASFFKILKPKIPFLLNLQDGDTDEVIDKKTKGIKFIGKLIYKKPDVITAISKFLKERALQNGSEAKIEIIPNGVETKEFDKELSFENIQNLKKELNLSPNDKVIITTSRLNYKNAIDDLIKSLNYLDNSYKLLILGEGEEYDTLFKLSKDNNLIDRVIFLGFISHDKLAKYLKIADVFCRPSLQEGLGNSFLEAMAAGLPIVATPVGGIPDFLTDRETGMFCEIKNPKSIADKISELVQDQGLRTHIIHQGKELICKKYDWEIVSESYRKLLTGPGENHEKNSRF